MNKYTLGHYPTMMQRFTERAELAGLPFLKPILPKKGKVLDIGCGNAALTKLIKTQNPKLDVYGLDLELRDINIVSFSNQIRPFLIQGNAHYLPLLDNSFNLVYLHASCLYFDSLEKVIGECYRVLNSSGKIALRNSSSVINNMDLFFDFSLFSKILNFSSIKNRDNLDVALNIEKELSKSNFRDISSKITIEKSDTPEKLNAVSQSSIELIKGTMGKNALNAKVANKKEIDDIVKGLESWAMSPKAYNKAIWVEHYATKQSI